MNTEKNAQVNKSSQSNAILPKGILQRKCACGQHTLGGEKCTTCKNKKLTQPLQTKLKIGKANDSYEQEADRIAGQITNTSNPNNIGGNKCSQSAPAIQRRFANALNGSTEAPSIVHDVLSSAGKPLENATLNYMEPRFGHDFSQVRIHNDSKAEKSANAVSARAYTVGQNIVFGAGQYSPGTSTGNHLLAHELTHVIQQGVADSTRFIEGSSEEKDSTRQIHQTISSDKAVDEISRKTAPKLRTGPTLQRAECPCCADGISISNINRIDTASQMGHRFDTNMGLLYPTSGPSGSCTLEWWEKTNIPAIPGHQPNVWTDMYQLMGGASFNTWNNRQESCGSSTSVTDTDPPALARRPGRTVTRTLEFRIVISSMPANSTSGCSNVDQQVTAKQVLKMVNGAPDWAASSFTTP